MAHLKTLQESQSDGPSYVERLQEERLAKLLQHAQSKVQYYESVLRDAGVVTSRGKLDLGNLTKVGPLDKQTLRSRFNELKSADLRRRRWHVNRSGGSTGEPVRFIQDAEHHDWMRAIKMLFDLWSGYKLGDRRLMLWGAPRDFGEGKSNLLVQLKWWLDNTRVHDSQRLTTEGIRAFVDTVNQYRPTQILAYATSLFEVAKYILQNDLRILHRSSIMVTADTLLPHMRETIEAAFGAQIFNRYGTREVGDIACETDRHEGLLIPPRTHYVEILGHNDRPVEEGEIGEIVVTSLTNYAMPLIRYRTGDMASWTPSTGSCGRNWKQLTSVEGRVTDALLLRDGTRVRLAPKWFYECDWIDKYQVVQDSYEKLTVRIVPKPRAAPADLLGRETESLTRRIKSVMTEECTVEFIFVTEIPLTQTGKYLYTVSNVDRESTLMPHGPNAT